MTSNSHISYKGKLVKLNILPLSLYQELHVGLVFAKILAGKVDIDWRSHVSITDVEKQKSSNDTKFRLQTNASEEVRVGFLVSGMSSC